MTATTRVCVVGSGAIGSLFAAHLGRLPDVEVWAYDVSPAHVDAINADGLRITGAADFRAEVHASTDPVPHPAVRSRHRRGEVRATPPRRSPRRRSIFGDAAVASVQNGLGNEERIAEVAPRVIRGTTLAAGAITAPGVVRYDATGGTWLGPFEPKPARMAEVTLLAELLERGGMTAAGLPDARGAAVDEAALQRRHERARRRHRAADRADRNGSGGARAREPAHRGGRRVADALGIALDADPEAMIDDAVARAFGHRASMLQDVTARRATEVDVLNGGIVAAAREAGLDAPLNEAMVALVHGIEASWALRPPTGATHEVTHLGHACLLVETGSARLLFDPGVLSDGFQASRASTRSSSPTSTRTMSILRRSPSSSGGIRVRC